MNTKECKQSAIFKQKTKWLFVILTQATGGHYTEVSSEGKKIRKEERLFIGLHFVSKGESTVWSCNVVKKKHLQS